jgi:hypothetical protein
MAVYSVTKLGFLTIAEMLADIDAELTTVKSTGEHYFKRVARMEQKEPYDATVGALQAVVNGHLTGPSATYDKQTQAVIYDGLPDIDPLSDYQVNNSNVSSNWRLVFHQIDKNRLAVYVGTEIQYPDSGNLAYLTNRSLDPAVSTLPSSRIEPPGNLAATWTSSGVPLLDSIEQVWLNRTPSPNEIAQRAYPMSYMMSMTNRGIYLGVWEDSQEEIPQMDPFTLDEVVEEKAGYGRSPFRWFLIQRSVDRKTGHVRGGGVMRGNNDPTKERSRCPVYVVGGTTFPKQFYKFIARELDVVSPSRKKPAIVDVEDSASLLNPFPQNSITEDGQFVVTFLYNLSTPRFRYGDELDMVGTVGAEVIGGGTVIDVNVYDEPSPRTYTAAYATMQYGTGMRLMVLTAANSAVEDSHVYLPDSVDTITANLASVMASQTVSFTISTTGFPSPTTVYWTDSGTSVSGESGDFVDGKKSGSVVLTGNTGVVTRTISSTPMVGNNIKLDIRRTPGTKGKILKTSSTVTIV